MLKLFNSYAFNKMSQEIQMTTTTKKENLSAFLDDESGNFEQRRLLDGLQKDDELLETLSRYTLIGDSMRKNQSTVTPPSDFLAGIHARLEEEPNYDHVHIEQQKDETSRAWLKPAAGFAVAASIVTVVTLNLFPTLNSDPERQPITTASKATAKASVVSASSDAQPLFMAQSTMKARLQRYIKSHVESTPNSAVMPSVRSFTHAKN